MAEEFSLLICLSFGFNDGKLSILTGALQEVSNLHQFLDRTLRQKSHFFFLFFFLLYAILQLKTVWFQQCTSRTSSAI